MKAQLPPQPACVFKKDSEPLDIYDNSEVKNYKPTEETITLTPKLSELPNSKIQAIYKSRINFE